MNKIEKIIEDMKDKTSDYPKSPEDITITTICSHTSLQLFESAKRFGFKTTGIIKSSDKATRESYNYLPKSKPDSFLTVHDYWDLIDNPEIESLGPNPIFIPHGSSVEYLKKEGVDRHGLELLKIPTFGNRRVIPWEFDRKSQRMWLEEKAGLLMPEEIDSPEEIKKPTMMKLKGAPGGRGAGIISSYKEYKRFMKANGDKCDYEGCTFQEFIDGTRYYLQFFASPFDLFPGTGLELFGMDRRDESNADEFYKLGSRGELLKQGLYPTFNVTGNIPVVMRESILMRQGFPAGIKTLEASKDIIKDGLIGPFCLEGVVDPDSNFYVFEISGRIVAGSNAMVNGSPYAKFTYPDKIIEYMEHINMKYSDMNYADRMMFEIRHAANKNELEKVIT